METEADEPTAQLALLETGECQVMLVIRERDGEGRTFNEGSGGFFLILYRPGATTVAPPRGGASSSPPIRLSNHHRDHATEANEMEPWTRNRWRAYSQAQRHRVGLFSSTNTVHRMAHKPFLGFFCGGTC